MHQSQRNVIEIVEKYFREEYIANSQNIDKYLLDYVMAGSEKPVLNNYIESIENIVFKT